MIYALSRGYVLDKDNKCLEEARIIGIRDQLFNIWWRGGGGPCSVLEMKI